MVRLVQKTGYIKGGKAAGYMQYIATREGVQTIEGSGDPTPKQKELIQNILRDFPDTKELFEYGDYRNAPCVRTASAFIGAALDYNAEAVQSKEIYMKYISTRPGVEKHREHGLFGSSLHVDLDTAMWFLQKNEGNVWTFIFSLRCEDAERLGYASAEKWQRLLSFHQMKFANTLGIDQENLRWYAAYHDADSHPHVHMMVWSDDPSQGYLTQEGVLSIRSMMTNEIFKDEMKHLYEQKDISYKELKAQVQKTMRELIAQMENSMCASPVIEQRMTELVMALGNANGKKQYGYLKKPAKEIVDAIVDELAKQPEVAQCYEAWNSLRDELESYYKDRPREHLPLSQQKEFKVIKNMVIQEAENIRLGSRLSRTRRWTMIRSWNFPSWKKRSGGLCGMCSMGRKKNRLPPKSRTSNTSGVLATPTPRISWVSCTGTAGRWCRTMRRPSNGSFSQLRSGTAIPSTPSAKCSSAGAE